MAIEIVIKNNIHCPCAVCDYCRKEIKDAKKGNYLWLPDGKSIVTLHKSCTRHFEAASMNDRWLADELSRFLVYLSKNLNSDVVEMSEGSQHQ